MCTKVRATYDDNRNMTDVTNYQEARIEALKRRVQELQHDNLVLLNENVELQDRLASTMGFLSDGPITMTQGADGVWADPDQDLEAELVDVLVGAR